MKIMFDSNVFDKLPEYINRIKQATGKFEIYITTIQIEELCEIPDDKMEKRKANILMLADLRATLVPLASFLLNGRARLGYARFGAGEVYKKILKESGSNSDDALIADTAVSEGCVLVTEDLDLYHRMQQNGYAVWKFQEFLEKVDEEAEAGPG